MSEIISFLEGGSPIALAISVGLVLLSILASVLYTVAFFQGRAISFWPPSIGEKPHSAANHTIEKMTSEGRDEWVYGSRQNPIVDRGTVLTSSSAKHYKVRSAFYGGANATIYKVQDENSADFIAKVYWRGLQPNSPPWEIFKKELSVAEKLHHRNIVKTLDRGLHSGYPYSIMEYLSGGTLRDWLRSHEAMQGSDVLSIASQVGAAIDYAHSRGVVHRDIKPGNILFEDSPSDRVSLSDFGIAATLGAVQRDITAIGGEFAGSATYLAPEAISDDAISSAMDIYSFGVVLFEMIAGSTPFDDIVSPLAIMRAKVDQQARDIREFRSSVPEAIAGRLEQALSRDPAHRPTSAVGLFAGVEEQIRSL